MPEARGLLCRFALIIALLGYRGIGEVRCAERFDCGGERWKDRLLEGLWFGASRTENTGNFRDAIQHWFHQ
jgi:hypothetical protein